MWICGSVSLYFTVDVLSRYLFIYSNTSIHRQGIAGGWGIFLVGVTAGRLTPDWRGWDYVAQPVVLLFRMYWWLICIAAGVGLEVLSEIVLDRYREPKQFPHWPGGR